MLVELSYTSLVTAQLQVSSPQPACAACMCCVALCKDKAALWFAVLVLDTFCACMPKPEATMRLIVRVVKGFVAVCCLLYACMHT